MTKIELRENTKRGGGQSTDWLQANYTFAVPPCVPMNRCGADVLVLKPGWVQRIPRGWSRIVRTSAHYQRGPDQGT